MLLCSDIFSFCHVLFLDRYQNDNMRSYLLLCSAMDPRFKYLPFASHTEVGMTWSNVTARSSQLSDQQPSIGNVSSSPVEGDKSYIDDLFSASVFRYSSATSTMSAMSTHEQVTEEVIKYRALPLLNLSDCPLTWWRDHDSLSCTIETC